MPTKTRIFINLPVADLERSKAFFAALGFGFDLRFTDETAACMAVSEEIFVMLLTHEKFGQFSPLPIADARKANEVLLALSYGSREEVDEVMAKALDAGATEVRPADDLGFMYGRSFADLDGHIWEPVWLSINQMMADKAD
ncbi:MAG: hypothetical protein EON60_13755 [Alphaproteobacteria bacterium]|nr:MAG: hypothetical protein EON60_13755 [Alphaproteobacteria bacterium]